MTSKIYEITYAFAHSTFSVLYSPADPGEAMHLCVSSGGACPKGRPTATVQCHHLLVPPSQPALEEECRGGPHNHLPTWPQRQCGQIHTWYAQMHSPCVLHQTQSSCGQMRLNFVFVMILPTIHWSSNHPNHIWSFCDVPLCHMKNRKTQ